MHLRGCTLEPLGNYLKGLGVFRLIAEQADPQARAWWQDGYLHIATKWPNDVIVSFFLHGFGESSVKQDRIYSPTPIFAPWGGRPGFYKDGNAKAKVRLDSIRAIDPSGRFALAQQIIQEIDASLESREWATATKKDRAKLKTSIVGLMRNSWSHAGLDWFDACLTLEEDTRFGFLYGTGGNEGSADITNNFWELLEETIGFSEIPVLSEEMFYSTVFGNSRCGGTNRTAGQHFPLAGGSANCGQSFFGSSSANPWDVVLMMEGAILFSGALTKRLSQHGKGKAAFPFMIDHLATNEIATSINDEASQDTQVTRCRAEFWMPLWQSPTSLNGLRALLSEGKMQRASGQPSEHTLHALEAMNSLGVSRGIDTFHRVALFERRGKGYYLASSLGFYSTSNRAPFFLEQLKEIDQTRNDVFRNLRTGPSVPERIMRARRNLHSALAIVTQLDAANCQDGLLNLLVALSIVELEVSLVKDHKKLMALIPPLTKRWNPKADGSHEFTIARSIAGIAAWGEKRNSDSAVVETLRSNLLPVERKYRTWHWDDTSRSSVWSRGASIDNNLAAILRRRLVDSQRGRGEGLPLWTAFGAGFIDILAFWNREVDESRIAALIHGLALTDTGKWGDDAIIEAQVRRDPTPDLQTGGVYFTSDGDARTQLKAVQWQDKTLLSKAELQAAFELPRVYHLLKLCFVGGQLPRRPADRKLVVRTGDEPFPANSLDILTLLQAGRLSDALTLAVRRLRAKGYPSLLKEADFTSIDLDEVQCRRLASMMLIPIRLPGVCAALAIKPQTTNS